MTPKIREGMPGGGLSTTIAAPSAPSSQTVYLSARHSVPIGVTIKHAPHTRHTRRRRRASV